MTGSHLGTRPAAWTAALVLGVTAGGVIGGGSAHAEDIDTLSAQQIADRSRDALLGVESLHLSSEGKLSEGGTSMSLELTLDRDGNCNGSVDLGSDQGSALVVKRGDDIWIKPDADFWKNQVPNGGTTFAAIVGDRYVKGHADDPRLRAVTKTCDLNTFQKLVSDNANDDTGTLNKGEKTTVDGSSVIPLTRMRDGTTLTVDVAATGKPYPLRLAVRGNGADAVVNLSDFGRPVPRNTPPPSETFDVSALLGRTNNPV
ncbi:hypothetical protein ACWC1D_25780 [Streptomyces sp. NPDC001478]